MYASCADNIQQDKAILTKALHVGLDYICQSNWAQIPDGRHEIDKNNYVMISTYIVEPPEDRRLEAHKQYIDIQFIIDGEEEIGYADSSRAGMLQEQIVERDLYFYDSVDKETYLKMTAGSYAVFYPWDIHRPNCQSIPGSKVRKAVVKVLYTNDENFQAK